jgi:hypothetical protein
MIYRNSFIFIALIGLWSAGPFAAEIDQDQPGGWYMVTFNKDFSESRFGFQGDVQYRTWDGSGDLEQLLLRGGITYRPDALPGKSTLGLANITSGQFGDSKQTRTENRTYQEAMIPQRLGQKGFLKHRFRFEQRWVNGQDFRTRLRYALFANVPLNRPDLSPGAFYLAVYNEVFINGERDIGGGAEVDFYDRNRLYGALGYKFSNTGQIQVGYMQQHTNVVNKGQFQLSLHYNF